MTDRVAESGQITFAFDAPSVGPCRYAACPACDGCGVCRNFHGNFVGRCGEGDCPYRWYHRVRDWFRRAIERRRVRVESLR